MSDNTSPRKDDGTSTSTVIMGSKIVFWELRNKVSMNVDTQARIAPVNIKMGSVSQGAMCND